MTRRVGLLILALSLALSFAACDDAEPVLFEEPTADLTATPAPEAAELLPITNIEAVSGLNGLAVAPYDPDTGAHGDLNVVDADGALVLVLIVEGPEAWDQWLTDGFTVREPVSPAVGEESFIGPNPDVSEGVYIFGFRQDGVSVLLETFDDPGGNGAVLSTEHLRTLAEMVSSRL